MKHANEHLPKKKTDDFPSYYKLPFCSGTSQLSTFDWQRISPIIPRDVPMISHFCWLIFIKQYLKIYLKSSTYLISAAFAATLIM